MPTGGSPLSGSVARRSFRTLAGYDGGQVILGASVAICILLIDRSSPVKLGAQELLGIYGAATAVVLLPSMVFDALARAVLARLSTRRLGRSPDELGRRLEPARETLLAAGAFFVVGIVLEGPTILRLLSGERQAAAGEVVRLLALPVWFTMLGATLEGVVRARGFIGNAAVHRASKLAATATLAAVGYVCGDWPGFIVGYAGGILVGHGMVLSAAARHGVSVGRQDVAVTAMTAILVFFGVSLASSAERSYGPPIREAAILIYLAALGLWASAKLRALRRKAG
jgi:O-antigen/teichoic acid export membrane protein